MEVEKVKEAQQLQQYEIKCLRKCKIIKRTLTTSIFQETFFANMSQRQRTASLAKTKNSIRGFCQNSDFYFLNVSFHVLTLDFNHNL